MSRSSILLGGALLGATLLSSPLPASAQSRAEACMNETNRLASSMLDAPSQQQLAGGRQGAKLEDAQKNRMRSLLDEARSAARSGDADRCMEHLREARMEARNSGVGGRGGGSLGGDETNSGTASSGSPGITPGTPGLGQGSASPDSIGTSGSTGSAGSRGPAGGTGLGGGTSGSVGGGSMGSGSGGGGASGGGM